MSRTPAATVVVPVMDEDKNVLALLRRLSDAFGLAQLTGEVLFIDDSSGPATGHAVREAANLGSPHLTIGYIHRPHSERTGLGTAVVLGLQRAACDRVVVMDGDLQHPPEKVPELLSALEKNGAAIVMASRYTEGGSTDGLDGPIRQVVSRASTVAAKTLFGRALKRVTDPMTGFFAVRREEIQVESLAKTRGFKILLEMLVRHPHLERAEVPLEFAAREAGESKGDLMQGVEYMRQLAELRVNTLPSGVMRMTNFAFGGGLIALFGAVILAGMVKLGSTAAVAYATQLTVTWILNFVYNYKWTWRDQPREGMVRKMVWFAITRGAMQGASYVAFEWLSHHGVGYNLAYWPVLFAAMAVNYITSDKLVFTETSSRRKLMNQISWRRAAPYAATIGAVILLAAAIMRDGHWVLLAFLAAAAAFCFVLGATETYWRNYSWWTPEIMDAFAWPDPIPVAFSSRKFHTVIPALNEADHIGLTVDRVMLQDHPHHEVVVSLCECDSATIQAAKEAAAKYHGRVRLVISKHGRHRKSYQVNAAIRTIPVSRQHVVDIFDAEGGIQPLLLRSMEAVFAQTACDVVQGGVQLMNLNRWFNVFAAMEYKGWFEGNMARQVRTGVVLFGGNTIAMTTEHIARIGGIPDSLTEDGVAGIKSALVGAKVAVCYSPELCTRELSPPTIFNKVLGSLLWQRVRWVQGYFEELMSGEWLRLPTWSQRRSAGYGLAAPVLQAVCSVLLPVAIATAVFLKVPFMLCLGTFVPLIPYCLTVLAQVMHLADFARRFNQKVKVRHYVILITLAPAYQMILMAASAIAVWRHVTGHGDWYKTARRHNQNENALVTLEGAPA